MNAMRYYPKLSSTLVLPVLVAVLIGQPFRGGVILSIALFAVTIVLTRWLLRIEVDGETLAGRDPKRLRLARLRLSEVSSVAGTRVWGWTPGWLLKDTHGAEIFVNEGALADAGIRAKVKDVQTDRGTW